MLHVVEHLPFDLLLTTFQEAFRVLEPGGILIAEIPNSLNLTVGASTFWIDPTHQRPLHPEVLNFLAVHCGFEKTQIHGRNSLNTHDVAITDYFDISLVSFKPI